MKIKADATETLKEPQVPAKITELHEGQENSRPGGRRPLNQHQIERMRQHNARRQLTRVRKPRKMEMARESIGPVEQPIQQSVKKGESTLYGSSVLPQHRGGRQEDPSPGTSQDQRNTAQRPTHPIATHDNAKTDQKPRSTSGTGQTTTGPNTATQSGPR